MRDHVVVLSEHILAEVAKHHRGKFKATKRQADAVVTTLRVNSEIVKPAAVPHGTIQDKDDLPVLGTAISGSAECNVTGDHELLALATFHGIDIVALRAFYERLRS